jgi:hypothetical protein
MEKFMNLKGLAEKYLKAQKELEEFMLKNSAVINVLYNKEEEIEDFANEVVKVVRENKQGLENEKIKIAYIPVYKKSYDYRKFYESSNHKEKVILQDSGALDINKDKFEKLKEDGKISIDTVQACFQETLMSERVDIKLKERE